MGLLAQGGAVGRVATNVGRLTLGAFDVLQVVATKTDVPSKVVGTVSNEILEVVELTSGAVTKVNEIITMRIGEGQRPSSRSFPQAQRRKTPFAFSSERVFGVDQLRVLFATP